MKMLDLKGLILDILFPQNCLGCGRSDVLLCDDCLRTIEPFSRRFKDFLRPNYLDTVMVAVEYDSPLFQKALHHFKYQYVKDLGKILAQLVKPELLAGKKDFILVPIPLHKKRLKRREFNQAEVIASEIAKRLGMVWRADVLLRTKNNTPQQKLKRVDRLENVKDIFRVNGSLNFKKVILVDDVLTTSATLNEAARVLKEAGVKEVVGLVLAHGK